MTIDAATLPSADPGRPPSGDFLAAVAVVAPGLDFDALVRTYQRRLFRLFLGWGHDREGADALTQECFLRAWRRRESFRGEGSVESWLLRIACNLLRDQKKSRLERFWHGLLRLGESDEAAAEPRTVAAWTRLADPTASPEEDLLRRERDGQLAVAIAALPGRQQAVFRLRFIEGLPLAEIAHLLELEVGTVKAHLSRAVGNLRRRTHVDEALPAPSGARSSSASKSETAP